MACLEHGRLQSPLRRDVRLFFHCRDRARTLTLAGWFTGVDPGTGELLATVVPTSPFLYEAELDRYIKDARATDVERLIEISARNKTWIWTLGAGLVDPAGRARAARGGSTGTRQIRGKATSYETYRFASGITLTISHAGRPSRGGSWQSNDFFVVQLVDGQAHTRCELLVAGGRQSCTLKQIAPTWKHAAGPKRAATTEAIAIQVATQFIIDNGYTDQPATAHLGNISRESLEPVDVAERLAQRHDTLEASPYGVSGAPSTGWVVVFRYKNQPANPRGRAVQVDAFGRALGVAHQGFMLDQCARRLGSSGP
jgi:hypothetical protein